MEETVKYLLVGGGEASAWAAQYIRERDHVGTITLIGWEPNPPIDRPPLSKEFLLDDSLSKDYPEIKNRAFYETSKINLRTGTKAINLDRQNRIVTLENGDTIRYEKLLLATGATPRYMNVLGHDMSNIYYLRTVDDAEKIRSAIKHEREVVMVGSGYIGMEVGAICSQRGLKVTIISPDERPLKRAGSPLFSRFMQEYYESKGIKFLLGQQVTSFLGNVSVSEVVTDKGTKIPADFVVAGIGVVLNNELAKASGLEMTERGEVIVDEYLRTSDPNIWAAGDITYFNDIAMGTKWHVEHNQNAKWQGRQAGAIMAGDSKPYNKVAYFYSDVFDIHLNIRGAIHLTTQSKMLGDVKGGEFVELYYNDADQLRMTIACSHDDHKLDPISDKAEELIRAKANVHDITMSTFGL